VVGWQVRDTTLKNVLISTLRWDLLALTPVAGLLVHSDRGGQYCGNAYRALLAAYGCLRSQIRRAEYLENAQAESLWSRRKTEELKARKKPVFRDLADAQ
jgi:putative transposase